MRNYDAVMKQMTPAALAEVNVKLVIVDNRRLFYMTSSGQLFNQNEYEKAVQHEYNWLMYDPSVEVANAAVEPDVNREGCETESAECKKDK